MNGEGVSADACVDGVTVVSVSVSVAVLVPVSVLVSVLVPVSLSSHAIPISCKPSRTSDESRRASADDSMSSVAGDVSVAVDADNVDADADVDVDVDVDVAVSYTHLTLPTT